MQTPACACLCLLLRGVRACSEPRSDMARGGVQESDLKQIFEPFGAVDYITLQHDGAGRSQGFGFVQCAPMGHRGGPCAVTRMRPHNALCCCSALVCCKLSKDSAHWRTGQRGSTLLY